MADAYVTFGIKEEDYVYSPRQNPASGTLQIASATCSLYDAGGAIAGSVSGATALFDTAASASPVGPRLWYELKPTALGLTPGFYLLQFLYVDSAGLKRETTVGIQVLADGSG